MNGAALERLVANGESETLEFKRSTAELRRAGETLCAFLNGEGGQVVIGVAPDGRVIEVRSIGDFPAGIRAEMLSGKHPSVLRNPLIAGAFHRIGAVEVWGRGTNRVTEACRTYGIDPPEFSEQAGVVTVTFSATVMPEAVPGPRWDQVGPKLGLSRDQVQVLELAQISRSTGELIQPSGRTNRTKFRDQVLSPLLATGLLEMIIPDKPRSPQQRYRTTAKGRRVLEEQMRSAGPHVSDEILTEPSEHP